VRPLLTMIIFTIIFSKLAKLPAQGSAPYAVMVYAAMLPWQFFSASLTEASNSLVGNANLITKVYFPRIIIPTSSVFTSLVDFGIAFLLYLGMLAWFQYMPPLQILLLPVFILLTFWCSFGISLYLTAVNVKYRDFRYIIPFIVQFGLYVSPVGFSSSIVPQKWQWLYNLNPMVGIIDAFRWCLLRDSPFNWNSFLTCIIITLASCYFGIRYFRRTERSFADNI
jgi:lipopolysaccharide transport system permease protein